MNKYELDQKLLRFIEAPGEFVCEVLFILNKTNEKAIKLADIAQADQETLKISFLDALNESIVKDEELRIVDISRIEQRKNTLFKYDYDEWPQGFEVILTLRNQHEFAQFSFVEDKLEEISGIIFILSIENLTLISYKQNYPINLYKRDSKAKGFWKSDNRFVQIPEDILKIYPNFDFFYLNDILFVKNVKVLEKNFGFDKVVAKKAQESLELIEAADLVVDISSMKERLTDITFARKLAQISSHSIVLNQLGIEEIVKFIDHFTPLTNKFRFNEDRSKFDLATKSSQNLFLKLLNDDYLSSQLTNLYYDSSNKAIVDT